jgi:predicted nucleic acid-binding protein
MNSFVVDTSVAVKWFFPEDGSEAAVALLDGEHRLLAPDLIYAEFGNVIWKKQRRGVFDAEAAATMVGQFRAMPLDVHASVNLIDHALALAIETGRTVYDCLFAALAVRESSPFITCDERLVNALARGALAGRVRLLGA